MVETGKSLVFVLGLSRETTNLMCIYRLTLRNWLMGLWRLDSPKSDWWRVAVFAWSIWAEFPLPRPLVFFYSGLQLIGWSSLTHMKTNQFHPKKHLHRKIHSKCSNLWTPWPSQVDTKLTTFSYKYMTIIKFFVLAWIFKNHNINFYKLIFF